MLEAAVTDALDSDVEYRLTVGWFLALPLVAAVAIGAAVDLEPAVPVGVVGALLLVGYGRRVLVASVVDPDVPAVDELAALATSALVGGAVVFAIVVLPTGAATFALWADVSPISTAVSELTAATAVAVVFAIGAYLTPAALAVSGRQLTEPGSDPVHRRVDSRAGAVRTIVSSRDYVVATLQAILLTFTVGAATLMLLVTVFGLVLLPAVLFLALLVSSRRYAYAVDRAVDPIAIEELDARTVSWL